MSWELSKSNVKTSYFCIYAKYYNVYFELSKSWNGCQVFLVIISCWNLWYKRYSKDTAVLFSSLVAIFLHVACSSWSPVLCIFTYLQTTLDSVLFTSPCSTCPPLFFLPFYLEQWIWYLDHRHNFCFYVYIILFVAFERYITKFL